MSTAPKNREITIQANFGPIDPRPFFTRAHHDVARGWVVKREMIGQAGSYELLNVNALGWLP
jgi:hypothetical protein